MKCSCDVAPVVRRGTPKKEKDRALWVQVFTCNNPLCINCGKDIGERRVNIFDEADVEEEYYNSVNSGKEENPLEI